MDYMYIIIPLATIAAFIVGKFYPNTYKRKIYLFSPLVTLSLSLILYGIGHKGLLDFVVLMFFMIPFYILFGVLFGSVALIPASLGARMNNNQIVGIE